MKRTIEYQKANHNKFFLGLEASFGEVFDAVARPTPEITKKLSRTMKNIYL